MVAVCVVLWEKGLAICRVAKQEESYSVYFEDVPLPTGQGELDVGAVRVMLRRSSLVVLAGALPEALVC